MDQQLCRRSQSQLVLCVRHFDGPRASDQLCTGNLHPFCRDRLGVRPTAYETGQYLTNGVFCAVDGLTVDLRAFLRASNLALSDPNGQLHEQQDHDGALHQSFSI